MPVIETWSLPVAESIEGPPAITMRVAPATPLIALKAGSYKPPAR
jgi:hypothetical protein